MSSSTVSIPTHINNTIKSITAVLVDECLEVIHEKREHVITKYLELFYRLTINTNPIKQDDNQLPIDKIDINIDEKSDIELNSNSHVPIITNKSKMTVNNNIETSQRKKLSKKKSSKNSVYLKSIRDPNTSYNQYSTSICNFINENIIKTCENEDMISLSDIRDTYDEWVKADNYKNDEFINTVIKNICNNSMQSSKVKINGEIYWKGYKWIE